MGQTKKLFAGVSMETWGVSLTWGQACWRGLPGMLGVGGNYLRCLVIVMIMRIGRPKRLGGRGGLKVVIWGRACHKERQFLWGGVDSPPSLGTIGLSNYYYFFNTILTRKIQHNIFHFCQYHIIFSLWP